MSDVMIYEHKQARQCSNRQQFEREAGPWTYILSGVNSQNVAYHFLRVILKWDIFETHSMVSTYNDLVYLMHLFYTLSSLCETVYARKQVNHRYQIRN